MRLQSDLNAVRSHHALSLKPLANSDPPDMHMQIREKLDSVDKT